MKRARFCSIGFVVIALATAGCAHRLSKEAQQVEAQQLIHGLIEQQLYLDHQRAMSQAPDATEKKAEPDPRAAPPEK